MSLIFVWVDLLTPDLRAVRSTIQAKYDSLDRAFRRKDARIFGNLMTKDFQTVGLDGKTLDRAAALKSFEGLMMSSEHTKWPRKIRKIQMDGTQVTVVVEGHFVGSLPAKVGKRHLTELKTTVEDIWRNTSEGWEISNSAIKKLSMWQDGKPTGL